MVRSPTRPALHLEYEASAPTSRQQGYRQFVVNGKPVLIRGAGWAPDMFLRDDPKRMEAEFSYVLNLGSIPFAVRGSSRTSASTNSPTVTAS